MTTAHQLARKLLAMPDVEVVLTVDGTAGGRIKTVDSVESLKGDARVLERVVVLTAEPVKYDLHPY